MTGGFPMTLIRHQVNRFLGAVVFLTRIPVGSLYVFRAEELPRSAVYFPLVGLLVGALSGSVLCAARFVFSSLIAALLCMLTSVLLTGALHEDGLADAADALPGGDTRDRRLAIMKGSTIGVYGTAALWFSLTGKLLLIGALLERGAFFAFAAVVVANGLGRASSVALLFTCPYAREEESKASPFACGITAGEMAGSLVAPAAAAFLLLGSAGLACLGITAGVVWAGGIFYRKLIGGITGDCLGATNQLVEILCYLALAGGRVALRG